MINRYRELKVVITQHLSTSGVSTLPCPTFSRWTPLESRLIWWGKVKYSIATPLAVLGVDRGNVWLPLGAAAMVVVETLNEGQMSYLRYPAICMSTYTRDHCLTMGSICRLSSSKEREVFEVRAHPAHSRSEEQCVFKPHVFLLVPF